MTVGSPLGRTSKLATHSVRSVGRGIQVESFHPPSTFETYEQGIDHPLQRRDNQNVTLKDSSVAFVQQRLGVNASTVSFRTGFSGEVAKHAYVTQIHNGIPFANALANVAFNHDDKVVAFGSSFVKPSSVYRLPNDYLMNLLSFLAASIASSTPSVPLSAAISKAEESLLGTYNNHATSIQYIVKSDGSATLTHAIQIQNETAVTFYEAFIDAHSGELIHVTDYKAPASYRALPIQEEIPTEGFKTLDDPQDILASPDGWHTVGNTTYNATRGNNAMSYQGGVTMLSAPSSPVLNFIYPQNPDISPTMFPNVDAARTNTFYIVNTLHDTWYRYGFTEAAYNFQADNFGKGGLGNDYVTIAVQSDAGLDNSDFLTPPDGQFGQMHMYLWDYTTPERDGSLENDIVTHENTHGMTNRMVGGGTAACLQTLESGGLGEDIGEIWANMLHNVYAPLVIAHGWSANAHTDPSGTEGNIVFLHLYIDALPLLPLIRPKAFLSPLDSLLSRSESGNQSETMPTLTNPHTVLNVRDAWLQADVNRYAGANKCLLWVAFASRGMGVNAADYHDSADVPEGC
ncbi:hypothetical protein C0989_010341 [Termitomyces sp. Mn162]|nr:hypothetical protein C0989_010341 [Termitomyces sp. Mn162]